MKCDEKEAAREKPFEPESPNVVVCEGFHEMGLVCALLRHLGINNCDVTYPKKRDGGNGKEAIGKVIRLLAEKKPNPSGIFIFTDAEENPDRSFELARNAFHKPYPAPDRPFVINRNNGYKTAVYLAPGEGRRGSLEALLIDAIHGQRPTALTCIEQLITCLGTMAEWPNDKKDKMRLTCYIASHCEKQPACSPAFMWSYELLDIANAAFTPLANMLRDFSTEAGVRE